MNAVALPQEFLVAFSFAGEQRNLVRAIAEGVRDRLGPDCVFFDDWYEHYIAGIDAEKRLQDIYFRQTVVVVLCVSGEYDKKLWPQTEYQAVRALYRRLTGASEQEQLRILPLRVGDGEVEGIFTETAIIPDARKKTVDETVSLILKRLGLLRDIPTASSAPRSVYLAHTEPNLSDTTKPISRQRLKAFLEDRGWTVLPASEYPEEQFDNLAATDMQQCAAFVQLLGATVGDHDRRQHAVATSAGIRQYRYRLPNIDWKTVDADAREFLKTSDVISGNFEDFKLHVGKELEGLRYGQPKPEPPPEARPSRPPLVRVIVRSKTPRVLWAKAFNWIYMQEQIGSDEFLPDEKLEERQKVDPCHGFLIACDKAAVDDGQLSTREYLRQCRLIQLNEKDDARCPPVALVYWPPPSASPDVWATLVPTTPLNFHRVEGDAPQQLGRFFQQVRSVAQNA